MELTLVLVGRSPLALDILEQEIVVVVPPCGPRILAPREVPVLWELEKGAVLGLER